MRQVVVYAHIDNTQMETMLSAKHVDATTATREVNHLLPRHLTRTNADTFALNTVVATQQQMTGVCQRGLQRLLDKAYLHGQFLQASQRTLGFVQVVYLLLNGRL